MTFAAPDVAFGRHRGPAAVLTIFLVASCRPRREPAVEVAGAAGVRGAARAVDGAAAGDAHAAAPAPEGPLSRQVLATFAAPPYTYEVSIERHGPRPASEDPAPDDWVGGDYPFTVRLLKAGKPIDLIRLFLSGCGPGTPVAIGEVLGADLDAKSWATDDDRCDINFAARSVDLAPQRTGLLLTQIMGSEYRYRSQDLYLAQSDRLRRIWSHAEPDTADERTKTRIIAAGEPGRQDVAYIELTRTREAVAAHFAAKRLHLDIATGEIVESPLPDENAALYLVQVGSFNSAKAALRVSSKCLAPFDVWRGSLHPDLRLPRFFNGAMFALRRDAEAAVAGLAACPELPKANIFEQRSTGGKRHGGHH